MNNQEKSNYVKTQIIKALLELMNEKPYEKISISELVSRARVARASFYRNYSDKDEALRQESARLMKEWGGEFKMDGSGNVSATLVSLLDFIKSRSEFYTTLYRAGQDDVLRETILSLFPIAPDAPNVLAYLTSSIGHMVYGWVHEWLKRGMQESGTEIVRMFEAAQKRQ